MACACVHMTLRLLPVCPELYELGVDWQAGVRQPTNSCASAVPATLYIPPSLPSCQCIWRTQFRNLNVLVVVKQKSIYSHILTTVAHSVVASETQPDSASTSGKKSFSKWCFDCVKAGCDSGSTLMHWQLSSIPFISASPRPGAWAFLLGPEKRRGQYSEVHWH